MLDRSRQVNIQQIINKGRAKKTLFCLTAALLAGCLPVMSLHPVYNEKQVVFEEKLLGTWIDDPNDPDTTWKFSRIDEPDNAYALTFSDDEGKRGSFVARLVKLRPAENDAPSRLFMDVFPGEMPWELQDPNKHQLPYNQLFLIPAHTLIKIDAVDPKLKMRITNEKEIKKLLEEHPGAVKHTFINERLVLTASTKELQKFFLRHADDKRVFPGEIVLGRANTKRR
jgi:hypothetical protein